MGWWFGLSGLVAMTATCPCCGQAGCPAGAAGLGAIGAAIASLTRFFRFTIRPGNRQDDDSCRVIPYHAVTDGHSVKQEGCDNDNQQDRSAIVHEGRHRVGDGDHGGGTDRRG